MVVSPSLRQSGFLFRKLSRHLVASRRDAAEWNSYSAVAVGSEEYSITCPPKRATAADYVGFAFPSLAAGAFRGTVKRLPTLWIIDRRTSVREV